MADRTRVTTCPRCGDPIDKRGAVSWLYADGWDGTYWHPECALKEPLEENRGDQ